MMTFQKQLSYAILSLSLVITLIFYLGDGPKKQVLYGDALGYYMYLPAAIIFHNLTDFRNIPENKGIPADVIWYGKNSMETWKAPNGAIVNQYTYVIAFFEFPFFLAAHAMEKGMGQQASGFTNTYSSLIKLSSLVYALGGLILIFKILRRYFNDFISALTVFAILLGTNLFWFTAYQGGMSHPVIFFLYALLIFLVIKIQDNPTPKLFAAAGCIAGLITVARPTDILCLLIPLLYNVYNKQTLRDKLQFVKSNGRNIMVMAAAFLFPLVPQMLYWKATAGSYIYYSYGTQSFDWAHPKIIDGLFYFSNGWLPYSPLMLFSLLGMFIYKPLRPWLWCILLIFVLYVYIIYSWYCYNYINGLGSRPMIHLYPLLALPLAAFFQWVASRSTWVKSAAFIVCSFCLAVNISYSMQQSRGLLDSPVSNIKFNLQTLFQMRLSYDDLVVKDTWAFQPDTTKIARLSRLACMTFEDSTSLNYVHAPASVGKFVYRMPADEYQQFVYTLYDSSLFKGAKWIKGSGRFMYPQAPDYYNHMLAMKLGDNVSRTCKIENKIRDWQNTRTENTVLEHAEPGRWGVVYFFLKLPKNLKNGDSLRLYVWNDGKKELYMDDLCLELYK